MEFCRLPRRACGLRAISCVKQKPVLGTRVGHDCGPAVLDLVLERLNGVVTMLGLAWPIPGQGVVHAVTPEACMLDKSLACEDAPGHMRSMCGVVRHAARTYWPVSERLRHQWHHACKWKARGVACSACFISKQAWPSWGRLSDQARRVTLTLETRAWCVSNIALR